MKLSVVVPVYNVKKYLRQCIESILDQSFKNIELILIDDGSTDGSDMLCDEYVYKDKRVKVFHNEHNGPLSSRKMGVEKSTGEYITFVDADDFVCERSFELAQSDMNNGIDVISFDIMRYFEKDRIRVDRDLFEEGIYSAKKIEAMIYPTMIWDEKKESFGLDPALCNKVFKQDLLKEQYQTDIGVESFHYGEDVAIIYPLMLRANTLSVHHEAYYYHRQREAGCIAHYIADDKFFDKLYFLYRHLVHIFAGKDIFQKQIDLFYLYSVMLKGRQYGKPWHYFNRIFPFDKVPAGKKVVLYGAGEVGKLYRDQVQAIDYCSLVLWVDKNYANLKDGNVTSPENIFQCDFDYIVVAVAYKQSAEEIVAWMRMNGIPETKIISNVSS